MAEGQGQISPRGNVRPPVGDTSTFLQKVAMRLYSLPSISKTADKVIDVGNKVAEVRDNAVRNVSTGLKIGAIFGPALIILLVVSYFFFMAGGVGLFRRGR